MKNPHTKTYSKLVEESLERIRSREKQAREQHHNLKRDIYVGKFFVRGSSNHSRLDKFIPSDKPLQVSEGRKLSGWALLQRFYEVTKNTAPIASKRVTCRAFMSDYWVVVYAGGYYVTITKSVDGLNGEHPMVLYYSPKSRENYAIASSIFEDHFTRGGVDKLHESIKYLRKTKSFYQSQAAKELQVPL